MKKSILAVLSMMFGLAAATPAMADPACTPAQPTAKISPDTQTLAEASVVNGVRTPTIVKLNGSPSTPGNTVSYLWEQLSGPPVSLSSTTDAHPTFTAPDVPPAGAALVFKLTVTDCSKTNTDSTTTTINLSNVVTNLPPVASAIVLPNGTVSEGTVVTLDGSASSDPNGDALTYAWSQIGASNAPLSKVDSAGAIVKFTAPNDAYPAGETLTFRLTVSDGSLSSQVDKIVNVAWVNDPPQAVLTCPATVDENAEITLDGNGSTDSDNGIAKYDWSQIAGGPVATLPNAASTSSIKFAAPQLTSSLDTMKFGLKVTDNGGLFRTAECDVTVLDKTAPVISGTNDIVKEATSAAGATATFAPTAHDAVDGDVAVICSPVSGAIFALGNTPVTCDAADKAGNKAEETFNVKVQDTTAPALTLPSSIGPVEGNILGGATVAFSPTANDIVDGPVTVTCDKVSESSVFPVGSTTVNCSSTDAHGNTAKGSFDVTVKDKTAPDITGIPTNMTDIIIGTAVTYNLPKATDVVDGVVSVTCAPESGSVLKLGSTTVTCSAVDKAGNLASASFNASVKYGFSGLLSPYDKSKSYKIKSTIPLKWQYTSNTGAVMASSTPKPSVLIYQVSNSIEASDPVTLDDAGASGYQYDSTTNTWQFNWKTTGLAAGTYDIYIQNPVTGQKDGPFAIQLSK